jgi:hypothetical protein
MPFAAFSGVNHDHKHTVLLGCDLLSEEDKDIVHLVWCHDCNVCQFMLQKQLLL